MAKYYVKCGRIRNVTNGASVEQAAHRVVHAAARSGDGRFLPMRALQPLGLVTAVSEIGFTDPAAVCYPTEWILREVGPFERFTWDRGSQ